MANAPNNSGVTSRELIEKATKRLTELCETAVRTGMHGTVGIEVQFKAGVPQIMRRLTNATER